MRTVVLALVGGIVLLAAILFVQRSRPQVDERDLTGMEPGRVEEGAGLSGGAQDTSERRPVTEDNLESARCLGVVRSSTQELLVGAVVQLRRAGEQRPLVQVATDDLGRFELTCPDAEPELELHVSAAGHTSTIVGEAAFGEDMLVTLQALLIRGRVVSAESSLPVAKARVDSGEVTALTGANGEFTIPYEAVHTELAVRVHHEEFVPAVLRVTPDDFVEQTLVIALQEGEVLRAQVVDCQTGRPVAEAELLVAGERYGAVSSDGELQVRVVRGSLLEGVVVAEGYCPLAWAWDVTTVPSRPRTLAMVPRATLEGSVLDSQGTPLGACEVSAVPEMGTAREYLRQLPASLMEGRVPGDLQYAEWSAKTATNESGLYVLGVPPLGSHYTVSAALFGYRSSDREGVQLDEPGSRQRIDFVLSLGAVVRVTVSRNGEPWDGFVRVQGEDGLQRQARVRAGECVLGDLAPGLTRFSVHRQGAEAVLAKTEIQVSPGEEYRVDLSFHVDEMTISGRVLRSGGEVVSGARVRADSETFSGPSTRTSSDGTYEIPVPPGTYRVSAGIGRLWGARGSIAAGSQGVEIVLPPEGTLTLVLADASSGALLESERSQFVSWAPSGDPRLRPLTARLDKGRVELRLPPGYVDLEIDLAGDGYVPVFLDGVAIPDGSEELSVSLTPAVDVLIELAGPESARLLEGRVVFLLHDDELEQVRGPLPPEEDSNITINGMRMWVESRRLQRQLLVFDDQGVATVSGLPEGDYSLLCFPTDRKCVPESIRLQGPNGQSVRVDVEDR